MKNRKSTTFSEEPTLLEGFSWGRDINPEAMEYGQIAVTPDGRPTAYIGYVDPDEHVQLSLSVGGRTVEARRSHQFLELRAGGLKLTSFLWDNQPFKVLEDRRLHLPRSADNTFGVITRQGKLDDAMTRTLFGATFDELEEFIGQFYSAIRYTPPPDCSWKPARITFSKSRDNHCDLTKVLIPK